MSSPLLETDFYKHGSSCNQRAAKAGQSASRYHLLPKRPECGSYFERMQMRLARPLGATSLADSSIQTDEESDRGGMRWLALFAAAALSLLLAANVVAQPATTYTPVGLSQKEVDAQKRWVKHLREKQKQLHKRERAKAKNALS